MYDVNIEAAYIISFISTILSDYLIIKRASALELMNLLDSCKNRSRFQTQGEKNAVLNATGEKIHFIANGEAAKKAESRRLAETSVGPWENDAKQNGAASSDESDKPTN